jgi:hypothetical protein
MITPTTENALLIRTDFSDQAGWDALLEVASNPADPFIFNMEVIDDRKNDGMTVDMLMAALPQDYQQSFIIVADGIAISQADHPLLVVDLLTERGRQFRAIAAEVATIDSNLSIANMGFEEFAEFVDGSGVFRGIPR